MKNYKRWFLAFVLVTVGWFSSMGCVTKALWRDSDTKVYNETIIAFYTNPVKNEIIFIGKKYHYIFDKGTSTFHEVLKARELLGLNQKHLSIITSIDRKDVSLIIAGIEIGFKKNLLNKEQLSWLESHDFIEYNYYNGKKELLFRKAFSLHGKRYKADSKVNAKVIKLNYPIELEIAEPLKNTLYKILMTPLSITADAGLAIAGAVIIPIIWIAEPRSRPKILR